MVTVPAVAVKVTDVPFTGTVTVAGTVSAALFEERPIVLPPEGAASFRVAVQDVVAPEFTLVGLQTRVDTTAGSIRLTVVICKLPFRVAVMVALWLFGSAPAVAIKLTELAPDGTVTDEGIVSSGLLSDSATVVPEVAIWLKPTVHVVDAPAVTVPGLQLNDVRLSCTTGVIVPPVAVVGIALPAAEVLNALVTLMVVPVVVGESVTVTTATTPLGMMLAFSPLEVMPVRKHM